MVIVATHNIAPSRPHKVNLLQHPPVMALNYVDLYAKEGDFLNHNLFYCNLTTSESTRK